MSHASISIILKEYIHYIIYFFFRVEDPDFIQDAGIPLYTETHAGEDVAIFARGPMAHLFSGIYIEIFDRHFLVYINVNAKYFINLLNFRITLNILK